MRILIVEDDDTTRELLGELTESLGHKTFLVSNLEQATETLVAAKPNLVLLDLLLRGTLATPFISLTRQLMPKNTPRIVIISAMQRAENVAKSNKVEFLKKPFDIDELEKLLTESSNAQSFDSKTENILPRYL